MRLWSWQSPKWSLLDGTVDWTKSHFYQGDERIRKAYHRLKQELEADQIIWCCTAPDDWPRKEGYAEWQLEVSEDHILAFVDEGIWEHQWCRLGSGLSANLRKRFDAECFEEAPGDIDCLDRKEAEYIAREGPLLVGSMDDAPSVLVLLRHPIPREWVIVDGRDNVQS